MFHKGQKVRIKGMSNRLYVWDYHKYYDGRCSYFLSDGHWHMESYLVALSPPPIKFK